jgi:flagellar biosynthesis protein FliP
MQGQRLRGATQAALGLVLLCAVGHALAANAPITPAPAIAMGSSGASSNLTSTMRLLVGLSFLSFIPAALVAMTSFTRIVVTLAFLRHALGMPETPPNSVVLTLALFLTFFTMAPVLEQSYRAGVGPFVEGKLGTDQALQRATDPLRTFMQAHVRPQDLAAVGSLAPKASAAADGSAPLQVLVPAFMLSELRAAFISGFIIFLPFLLIDLIVAAVLMALGMMMVPPVTISLPLKVLLFVLIDGWSLLMRAIAGAYA